MPLSDVFYGDRTGSWNRISCHILFLPGQNNDDRSQILLRDAYFPTATTHSSSGIGSPESGDDPAMGDNNFSATQLVDAAYTNPGVGDGAATNLIIVGGPASTHLGQWINTRLTPTGPGSLLNVPLAVDFLSDQGGGPPAPGITKIGAVHFVAPAGIDSNALEGSAFAATLKIGTATGNNFPVPPSTATYNFQRHLHPSQPDTVVDFAIIAYTPITATCTKPILLIAGIREMATYAAVNAIARGDAGGDLAATFNSTSIAIVRVEYPTNATADPNSFNPSSSSAWDGTGSVSILALNPAPSAATLNAFMSGSN